MLICHDVNDVFLEGSKLLGYMQLFFQGQIGFALFGISFFITRLVIFPFHVIFSIIYDGTLFTEMHKCEFPCQKAYVALLCALVCLHCYWFSLVLRMVYKLVILGGLRRDERSDSEVECVTDEWEDEEKEGEDGEGEGEREGEGEGNLNVNGRKVQTNRETEHMTGSEGDAIGYSGANSWRAAGEGEGARMRRAIGVRQREGEGEGEGEVN